MEKNSQKFLFNLLKADSPSGDEVKVQRVWLDYVKEFAEVKTDFAGNAYGIVNPKADFKVMLAGHCDEIGMLVTGIDEDCNIRFVQSGTLNPKMIAGQKVVVYGYSGKQIKGIIACHNGIRDDSIKLSDCYIDCGFDDVKKLKKLVRVGDYAVYQCEPEIIGENKLICKALDNKTGSFIVAEILRKLSKKKINVGVYSVSTTGEETNSRGAFAAAANIKPNLAIICDVTFHTKGIGGGADCALVTIGAGPALSVGSPINRNINVLLEKAAKKAKIPYQLEITADRTHTDADKIMYSGEGVPVALVSLPLKNMHSPVEIADMKDIDNTIDLIVEMIASLKGKENLCPCELIS